MFFNYDWNEEWEIPPKFQRKNKNKNKKPKQEQNSKLQIQFYRILDKHLKLQDKIYFPNWKNISYTL